MKILDRTVFRNFFLNLILWCLALSAIIIISDLLTHLDDFFNQGVETNPVIAIVLYYFHFCLRTTDAFLGFVVLISALNIVINMFRRNEIIALMALGTSPTRIILPILAAGIIVSAGTCWLRESFVPDRMIKVSGPKEYFTRKTVSVDVIPANEKVTGLRIDGDSVSLDGKKILNPVFTLPAPHGVESQKIQAAEAVWSPATTGREEGYILREIQNEEEIVRNGSIDVNGTARADQTDLETSNSPKFDEENILAAVPGDAEGLKPGEIFIFCGVPPKFLAVGEEWQNYASASDLIDAYTKSSLPYKPEELLARIHGRILKPVSDLFPLLLALPIMFVYKDGNPYKRGVFAALLAASYIGVSYGVSFLFRASASPSLKSWLPIILFLPVVTLLFKELKNS